MGAPAPALAAMALMAPTSCCIAVSILASDAAKRCSMPALNPVIVLDRACSASASFASLSVRRLSRLETTCDRFAFPCTNLVSTSPACDANAVIAACCWVRVSRIWFSALASWASGVAIGVHTTLERRLEKPTDSFATT